VNYYLDPAGIQS